MQTPPAAASPEALKELSQLLVSYQKELVTWFGKHLPPHAIDTGYYSGVCHPAWYDAPGDPTPRKAHGVARASLAAKLSTP
jgi:hypothetical protein